MKHFAPEREFGFDEPFALATEEGQDGAMVQWAKRQEETMKAEAARIERERQKELAI